MSSVHVCLNHTLLWRLMAPSHGPSAAKLNIEASEVRVVGCTAATLHGLLLSACRRITTRTESQQRPSRDERTWWCRRHLGSQRWHPALWRVFTAASVSAWTTPCFVFVSRLQQITRNTPAESKQRAGEWQRPDEELHSCITGPKPSGCNPDTSQQQPARATFKIKETFTD